MKLVGTLPPEVERRVAQLIELVSFLFTSHIRYIDHYNTELVSTGARSHNFQYVSSFLRTIFLGRRAGGGWRIGVC